MGNKGFSLPIIFLIVILFFAGFSVGLYFKDNKSQNPPIQQQTSINSQESKDSVTSETKRMLNYFLRDNLSEFPKFQAQVSPDRIKRIFPVSLKKVSEKGNQGWLVEVEKEKSRYPNSYYLLTPVLEQELKDVMSTVSEDTDATCILDKVQEVGNEGGLGRDLQEKGGYIILSGSKCFGYGAVNFGFVSIYSIATGEKIKIQGDFSVPGTVWKGVSPSGNALGILRGVYGINNPVLIIEYGQFESAVNKVEQVSIVAYFDLQSGKLKQLVKLD